MAAPKVVIEGSTVSAAQLKDLMRQISEGSITGEMLQAFLERKTPAEEVSLSQGPKKPTIYLKEMATLLIPAQAYKGKFRRFRMNMFGNNIYGEKVDDQHFLAHVMGYRGPYKLPASPPRNYKIFRLGTITRDLEIIDNLPENYLSSLEDIEWLMLYKSKSLLTNDDQPNLFYVRNCHGLIYTVLITYSSGSSQFTYRHEPVERGKDRWPRMQIFVREN